MKKIIRVATFMLLIIRRGKFRHSGYDYRQIRMKTLSDVIQFCPGQSGLDARQPLSNLRIFRNPYVKAWVAQAAFLKNALKSKPGHLSVPALNLSYIRNPKAASTALCFTMLLANFPELKKYTPAAETINYLADINLHKESTSVDRKGSFFMVVRNPFSRIVAVYREFFEQQQVHFIYDDYLFGIVSKDLSFKAFVKLLQLIPESLKDQHLKSQNSFLRFYRRKDIDVKIFKLEEPAALNIFLSAKGLLLDVVNKSGTPHDYRKYYDRETLKVVYNIYSQDISQFGYEAVYQELDQFVQNHVPG